VRKFDVKRLIKDEKGQTLILALILVVVGGLIIAPLLDYMGTGLISGQVYDQRTDELYAADAGVEDAVWKIQHQVTEVQQLYCGGGNHTWTYYITDVDGKSVAVTITYVNSKTYRVESTATADGSGTEIKGYIIGKSRYGDFGGLLTQIVTCQGENDIASKVILNYPEGCGPIEDYSGDWPTPADLEGFYWQDVKNVTAYGSGTIDINGVNTEKGPLYRNGTLEIVNSSNTPATLKLMGTLYITGDTLIGTTGKDFTLDLNGKTLFVSSNTTGNQKALTIGGKCSVQGPGCIVAVGDINFQPKGQVGGEDKPIFVLSASGTTTVQPSGTIIGAIAGSVEVVVQQGENPTITYPQGGFGDSLNFPTGIQYLAYSIASWEVIPL
jgi:hypothetical protein